MVNMADSVIPHLSRRQTDRLRVRQVVHVEVKQNLVMKALGGLQSLERRNVSLGLTSRVPRRHPRDWERELEA